MKPTATSRSGDAYRRLAQRIQQTVRDEHHNNLTGAERFIVRNVSPLILEQQAGSVILEDGDPDFTVGAWVRQYMLNYSLELGDQVWVLREGAEWHVVDVADPGGQHVIGA